MRASGSGSASRSQARPVRPGLHTHEPSACTTPRPEHVTASECSHEPPEWPEKQVQIREAMGK